MKNINGQGNEITIILPHKKIDCISPPIMNNSIKSSINPIS